MVAGACKGDERELIHGVASCSEEAKAAFQALGVNRAIQQIHNPRKSSESKKVMLCRGGDSSFRVEQNFFDFFKTRQTAPSAPLGSAFGGRMLK